MHLVLLAENSSENPPWICFSISYKKWLALLCYGLIWLDLFSLRQQYEDLYFRYSLSQNITGPHEGPLFDCKQFSNTWIMQCLNIDSVFWTLNSHSHMFFRSCFKCFINILLFHVWRSLEDLHWSPASRRRWRQGDPVPGGIIEPLCHWGT
jgi:hypothetical protein